MQKSFQEINKYETLIDLKEKIEHETDIMPYLDIPPDDIVFTEEDDLLSSGDGQEDDLQTMGSKLIYFFELSFAYQTIRSLL